MSDLYDSVKDKIDALINVYKAAVADNNVSLAEAWTMAQEAIRAFMVIAKELDATGPEKKAVVMKAVERLYDEVIAPMDIKAIPNMVEPIFDRLGKSLFLELSNGAVDFIFKYI